MLVEAEVRLKTLDIKEWRFCLEGERGDASWLALICVVVPYRLPWSSPSGDGENLDEDGMRLGCEICRRCLWWWCQCPRVLALIGWSLVVSSWWAFTKGWVPARAGVRTSLALGVGRAEVECEGLWPYGLLLL